DQDGPSLVVSSHTKYLFIHYSLFKHYAILVAAKVLKEAFGDYGTEPSGQTDGKLKLNLLEVGSFGEFDMMESPLMEHEFISVDIRVKHVKVKANLPKDPPMMLDIYHLDCGRYR